MSAQPSFTRILKSIIKFNLKFKIVTGLLIRMPVHGQTYRIGGADQYPMTTLIEYDGRELEVPLIPGSSLKGRMRALLEIVYGLKLYTTDQKIWMHVRSISAMRGSDPKDFLDDIDRRCVIDELFGWSAANFSQIKELIKEVTQQSSEEQLVKTTAQYFAKLAPTRLLVDDFVPSKDYIRSKEPKSIADFLEEKMENRIDRITAAADPRSIVRVKPNVEFEGQIKLLLYDIDKDIVEKYLETIAIGLKLVEETYLGGSGSRGYGRIKFNKILVEGLKVESVGENINLKKIQISKSEASSIDELLENIKSIAEEILKQVYE